MAIQVKGIAKYTRHKSYPSNVDAKTRYKVPKLVPPKPIYACSLPRSPDALASETKSSAGSTQNTRNAVLPQNKGVPPSNFFPEKFSTQNKTSALTSNWFLGSNQANKEKKDQFPVETSSSLQSKKGSKFSVTTLGSSETVQQKSTLLEEEQEEEEEDTTSKLRCGLHSGSNQNSSKPQSCLKENGHARTRSLTQALLGSIAVGPTIVVRSSRPDVKTVQTRNPSKTWSNVVPQLESAQKQMEVRSGLNALDKDIQEITAFPQLDEAIALKDELKGNKVLRSKDDPKKSLQGRKAQNFFQSNVAPVLSSVGKGDSDFGLSSQTVQKSLCHNFLDRIDLYECKSKSSQPFDVISQFLKFNHQFHSLNEPLPPCHFAQKSRLMNPFSNDDSLSQSVWLLKKSLTNTTCASPPEKTIWKSKEETQEQQVNHDISNSPYTCEEQLSLLSDSDRVEEQSKPPQQRFQRVKEYQIEFIGFQDTDKALKPSSLSENLGLNELQPSTAVKRIIHENRKSLNDKKDNRWRIQKANASNSYHLIENFVCLSDSRPYPSNACEEGKTQRQVCHANQDNLDQDLSAHGSDLAQQFFPTRECRLYVNECDKKGRKGLKPSGGRQSNVEKCTMNGWRHERYQMGARNNGNPVVNRDLSTLCSEKYKKISGHYPDELHLNNKSENTRESYDAKVSRHDSLGCQRVEHGNAFFSHRFPHSREPTPSSLMDLSFPSARYDYSLSQPHQQSRCVCCSAQTVASSNLSSLQSSTSRSDCFSNAAPTATAQKVMPGTMTNELYNCREYGSVQSQLPNASSNAHHVPSQGCTNGRCVHELNTSMFSVMTSLPHSNQQTSSHIAVPSGYSIKNPWEFNNFRPNPNKICSCIDSHMRTCCPRCSTPLQFVDILQDVSHSVVSKPQTHCISGPNDFLHPTKYAGRPCSSCSFSSTNSVTVNTQQCNAFPRSAPGNTYPVENVSQVHSMRKVCCEGVIRAKACPYLSENGMYYLKKCDDVSENTLLQGDVHLPPKSCTSSIEPSLPMYSAASNFAVRNIFHPCTACTRVSQIPHNSSNYFYHKSGLSDTHHEALERDAKFCSSKRSEQKRNAENILTDAPAEMYNRLHRPSCCSGGRPLIWVVTPDRGATLPQVERHLTEMNQTNSALASQAPLVLLECPTFNAPLSEQHLVYSLNNEGVKNSSDITEPALYSNGGNSPTLLCYNSPGHHQNVSSNNTLLC